MIFPHVPWWLMALWVAGIVVALVALLVRDATGEGRWYRNWRNRTTRFDRLWRRRGR